MNMPARMSSQTLVRETLSRVRLFADWPSSLLDRLAAVSKLKTYGDGEAVFLMGGKCASMVVLARGCLSVQRPLKDGGVAIFDFLLPGQSTSHLTVLDGMPNAFDVLAKGESDVIFVPGEAILGAIRKDPDRLMDVIQFLCRRTRIDYEATHIRIANSLRCQLAKLFLYWGRGHALQNGYEIPTSISQDDLAAMLGRSRQTINREVRRLVRDGLVAHRYKRLQVMDTAGLQKIIAEEEPTPALSDDVFFARPKHVMRASD